MARGRRKLGVTRERIARAVEIAKRGLESLEDMIDSLAKEYVIAQQLVANKLADSIDSGKLGEARYRAVREEEVRRILDRVNKATPLKARRIVTESVRLGTNINKAAGLFSSASAFSRVERTAIATLSDSLTGRLEDATNTVGRNVDDVFRREGLRLAALQLSQEQSPERATASLIDRLRRQGATSFIDRSGRQWGLDTYAEMVIKTTSSEGIFQGTTTTMIARGFDIVEVNSVKDPCPKCAKYDGNTYSLTGRSKKHPKLDIVFPIHPRCRHYVSPSVEAFAEREEFRASA